MKPVPQGVLLGLILTLCGLCAWQWHREGSLRQIALQQGSELAALKLTGQEADTRIQAANAEILRLTGTITELRASSIPAAQQEELQQENAKLREGLEKQKAALATQNELLTQADASIQQANESIKKVTAERDALTNRLNEVTAKYNKLANP